MIIRSYAKINLTLRVLGTRPDGYHELRTVFQTIALHDTLTLRPRRGPFALRCATPSVPLDASNLVWKAAAALWRAMGRTGMPRDVEVHLMKRIPMQAGLGGGSSNAAAAIGALARLWRARLSEADLAALAATLGADVPFFLHGGTALGVDRGDRIYPLPDFPPTWLVLVLPDFGVSTVEAYGWLDRAAKSRRASSRAPAGSHGAPRLPDGWPFPIADSTNDLEAPVIAWHPEIGAIKRRLLAAGATYAAMSGSGSAVFGLFESRAAADRAARRVTREGRPALVTRTMRRRTARAPV